ncbi:MAG TPA: hypothetical protein VHN99_09500, partial [Deinococcales bacterium]|nr:hypothetical protein [Deinococcales bacterium]
VPAAPEPSPLAGLDVPVAASIPAERSDFARMLQRGLEQEMHEHEHEPPEPAKKRGWNPFKK